MKNKAVLLVLLALAFLVRLYRFQAPLADWHSWRQADTASVARRYYQEGIDLFHPRYDDLSNIPSGKENPEGWRFVEFPFYNAIHCGAYRLTNVVRSNLSFEAAGRLTSILFSLGSLVFLYLLVSQFSSQLTALLSAFFFAVLPFNIFYSRAILPEPAMVFFFLAQFYFFSRWLKKEKPIDFILSLAAFAVALLIKPYLVFLGLPLIYLVWKKWGSGLFKKPKLYFYLGLSLLPFIAWRLWIQQFPEGIPAYMWLLNQNGIRLRPAFFRWLFADRLGKLILGYWGLIPFGLGLVLRPSKKEGWFYHWWLLGIFTYLTVFATGNVTHDYYQVITIPLICIFLAKGTEFFLKPAKKYFNLIVSYCLLITILSFMLFFSWFHVRDFFNINHPEIVAAGKAADQLLPPDAKVVAPYMGDTAFLYQTNRQGWPLGFWLKERVERGATHYVTVNFDDEASFLKENCQIIKETDQFLIVSLKNCSRLPEED